MVNLSVNAHAQTVVYCSSCDTYFLSVQFVYSCVLNLFLFPDLFFRYSINLRLVRLFCIILTLVHVNLRGSLSVLGLLSGCHKPEKAKEAESNQGKRQELYFGTLLLVIAALQNRVNVVITATLLWSCAVCLVSVDKFYGYFS